MPNADVHRMIASNSRTPARVLGDIRSLVVGGNMAAPRLVELCDKYGYGQVTEIIDELLDYTERLTRQGIERIPDGVYQGSYLVEDDGIEPGKHFLVQVTVTVEGSKCKLDFTGTDPQARGPINSSYSQSLSGVVVALRFFLDPDIPLNDGFYRPLEIIFPYGTLVNPKDPAAANARFAVLQAMMDAMNQALSKARPDKLLAPSGCPHVFTVTGMNPETNEFWSLLDVHMGVLGVREQGRNRRIATFPGWLARISAQCRALRMGVSGPLRLLPFPAGYGGRREIPRQRGNGQARGVQQ